ncbi:MAG: YafY family transcriptional regulator [Lachnospiraceae bacterium]|nr:YafY family transcriptional regulator [Lachnospiraceae bacterium]
MINRLISIIYILMNKGTVTANELAERFEVSVRTIYRDIDALSMAGIPVYAKKGKNGGISLTEQFVLNKLLITEQEQQEILAALSGMQETRAQDTGQVLQKLGEFFKTEPIDWLAIDLSDWSGARQQLYEELKRAILERRVICFDYYGQSNTMSSRVVEPVQLLFKEYTWYVKGYCRQRQAFRTFKVFRMKRMQVLEEYFVPRIESSTKENGQEETNTSEKNIAEQSKDINWTHIEMRIDKREAYRIYDRFEENELELLENGDFLVRLDCCLDDWVYGLILNFGPSATVLSPEYVRVEIVNRLNNMLANYEEDVKR